MDPIALKKGQTQHHNNTELLASAKHTAEEMFEKGKTYLTDVSRQMEDATKNVKTTIRRHPFESLLVGFGVGFISAIFARKLIN